MNKKIIISTLSSLAILFSCQVQNNLVKENNFKISNNLPIPAPSSNEEIPPLDFPPIDVPFDSDIVNDTNEVSFNRPRQRLDFDSPPPESFEIEKGTIIVIYHNNDKFRVRTTASVSSSNNFYSNSVNNILDKYNVQSVHSYGYYDPEDKNIIICEDKKHKNIDKEKEHKDKQDKNKETDNKDKNNNSNKDNKFKTKHINDSDHNNDGHHDHGKGYGHEQNSKICSSINYKDSTVTTQKIQEEQNLVSQYFDGEFPDKLSIHIYEFPEEYDTRQIARELRNLHFVRTAYPSLKTSLSSDVQSNLLGYLNPNVITPKPNDSIFNGSLSPFNVTTSFTEPYYGGDEYKDWYWYNQHRIFEGWNVYGNTPMPKIAVIDEGFDIASNDIDKPNYTNGVSVRFSHKDSFLWWSWDVFNETGDVQSNGANYSHGHAVASIISSPKNNSNGIAGIAPNTIILPLVNNDPEDSTLARCIDIASESDVDVINVSQNLESVDLLTYSPLISRSIAYATSKNKIFVMSAGNLSKELGKYPIDQDGIIRNKQYRINDSIVVGGTTNFNFRENKRDKGTYIWYKENFINNNKIEEGSNYGTDVDISASADNIIFSVYSKSSGIVNRFYGKKSGTSFATPMVAATAGMIKKIAQANGVNLKPYQIKEILVKSTTLHHDYDTRFSEIRYLGRELETANITGKKPNIRNLNLYNALTIAKNLSNYKMILRQYNSDDNIITTDNNNWSNYFYSSDYKSDAIIGLNFPDCRTYLNFRTLNNFDNTGYTYGYQLFYGKNYADRGYFSDYQTGLTFLDKYDGVAGIYGAESNLAKPRDYYARITKVLNNSLGNCPIYISSGNNPPFSTKVGGFQIKSFIDNNLSTPPIEANNNDVLAVSLNTNKTITANNILISIDDKTAVIKSIVDNYIAFSLPDNISEGIKDIVIKYVDNSASITFEQALKILSIRQDAIMITNNNESSFYPSFSPDNSKIVFLKKDYPYSQIWTMNSDGTNQNKVSDNDSVHHTGISFKPDGTKIIYTILNDPANIFTMNTDGTDKIQLTNYTGSGGYAVGKYSPDGEHVIVMQGISPGTNWKLYMMNSDGTNIELFVPSNNNSYDPKWSPDGRKIVYLSNIQGYDQIFTINSDGTGIRQITSGSYNHFVASFSNDSNKLFFSTNETGNYQMYMMNLDGTNKQRIHISDYNDYLYDISSDNRKLLFYSNRTGKNQIYTLNIN